MADTSYRSPVDGAALHKVERDGEDPVYRDLSTGVEYSEQYLKDNKVKKARAEAPAATAKKSESKKD